MSEIGILPSDTIPAGTYNFRIHISSPPTEGSWRGEHTFSQDIRASHAALLIAEECLGAHPDSITWLFLDQGGADHLFLSLSDVAP